MSNPHKNKTYLITGGTGFLGWHLIKYVCINSHFVD